MSGAKLIKITAATLLLLLLALALVVISSPPMTKPEICLQEFVATEEKPTDFVSDMPSWNSHKFLTRSATFVIRNPGRRSVGAAIGEALTGVVYVDSDSKTRQPLRYASELMFASKQITCLRPAESQHLMSMVLPAEAKTCLFRMAYWPPTARERWLMFCIKWNISKRYPALFKWAFAHLPDDRHEIEGTWEVQLPSQPELPGPSPTQ